MLDLKPYLDSVNASKDEVQRVAAEIDAHFRAGTPEGESEALALQVKLDEAQAKADKALQLYGSLTKANEPNELAKNFVPVSTTQPDPEASATPKVMKLAEFQAMTPADRMKFVKGGGKVEN